MFAEVEGGSDRADAVQMQQQHRHQEEQERQQLVEAVSTALKVACDGSYENSRIHSGQAFLWLVAWLQG